MFPEKASPAGRVAEIDALVLLRIAWAFKHVILIVALLCIVAAFYIALTATPVYRAEVVITPVRDGNGNGIASFASQLSGLASVAGLSFGQTGAAQEAQAVLKSRNLVQQFIERYDLAELLSVGSERSLWRAVRRFRDTVLTIDEDQSNGVTTVAIEWTDPKIAAQWANQFVALANELMRTRALAEATQNIAYLNKQIEQTNVVELQRVMYNLIEAEMQTLMLANAHLEYAFRVVDPAVAPEVRTRPNRKLIVLSGGVVGVVLGTLAALLWSAVRPGRARGST